MSPKTVVALLPSALTCGASGGGGAAAAGADSDAGSIDGGSDGEADMVVEIACTKGQQGCKGGLSPKQNGQEGPHTVVITRAGAMYVTNNIETHTRSNSCNNL